MKEFWAYYAFLEKGANAVKSGERPYCLKIGDIEIFGDTGHTQLIMLALKEDR
jgi:hypothetical protein